MSNPFLCEGKSSQRSQEMISQDKVLSWFTGAGSTVASM